MEIKKLLVIGIIVLFIGVAVAPSINFTVVKASNDNDLVEVTSQACGIKGFGDTTVKLTKQQYQNLEQYLVDFRARLNQTTTREEAVPIFKDAVVELNKYGLLPKGMSVSRGQKLVVGRFQNDGLMKIVEKVHPKNQKNSSNYFKNYFCLIGGQSTNTIFIGIPLIPIRLFSGIVFGYWVGDFGHGSHYYAASGSIQTFGLGGWKQAYGNMYGNIFTFSIGDIVELFEFDLGVLGFTGIQVGLVGSHFYFGFALLVDVYTH